MWHQISLCARKVKLFVLLFDRRSADEVVCVIIWQKVGRWSWLCCYLKDDWQMKLFVFLFDRRSADEVVCAVIWVLYKFHGCCAVCLCFTDPHGLIFSLVTEISSMSVWHANDNPVWCGNDSSRSLWTSLESSVVSRHSAAPVWRGCTQSCTGLVGVDLLASYNHYHLTVSKQDVLTSSVHVKCFCSM